jgi:hypothetical protein
MNALGQTSSLRICEPAKAVAHFLAAMRRSAQASYPLWQDVLTDALQDCPLGYDARRALLEIHPVADYYFAAVAGIEVGKIRALYSRPVAGELLALIAEQVDLVADRNDRLVSGLVFDVVGRVERLQANQQKLPHDQAVLAILERMGWHAALETRALFADLLFRHQLGEPFARGTLNWWGGFKTKFALIESELSPVATPSLPPELMISTPEPARIARPKKVVGARSLM